MQKEGSKPLLLRNVVLARCQAECHRPICGWRTRRQRPSTGRAVPRHGQGLHPGTPYRCQQLGRGRRAAPSRSGAELGQPCGDLALVGTPIAISRGPIQRPATFGSRTAIIGGAHGRLLRVLAVAIVVHQPIQVLSPAPSVAARTAYRQPGRKLASFDVHSTVGGGTLCRVTRIVMDTAVVVAALRSPAGASAVLLRMARLGRIILAATVPLCLEYEAVCSRPEHLAAAGASHADLAVFLDALVTLVEPVETWFSWRPQLRDADDELVLEAAVNGRSSAIATFNQRDFLPGAAYFGIEVLRPGDLLRRLAT